MSDLTQDELKAIQADIDKAKAELGATANADAARKAAEERQKAESAAMIAKLAEQEKANKELAEKLAAQEKAAAEKLAALTQRIDQVTASRATVVVQDPFAPPKAQTPAGLNLHDEGVMRSIEENSAEAFFGADLYETIKKQR